MMSAQKVVNIGMNAMFNRKMTVITGFINFIACHFSRFVPGKWSLWIGHQAMKNSVEYKPRSSKI